MTLAIDYDAVRAAIDVSLTGEILPDATIGGEIFEGAATDYIEDKVPTAQTTTGDDKIRLERALVYLTAAYAIPAVPQLISEKMGPASQTRAQVNWSERAADLRQRADEQIQKVLDSAATAPSRPTMFARAKGRRGL